MLLTLSKWLLFSVFMGSAPVFITSLVQVRGSRVNWSDLFSEGHLFLIAVILCSTAIGELLFAGHRNVVARWWLQGGCQGEVVF